MKTTRIFWRDLAISALLCALTAGCHRNTDDATPQSCCHIQQYSAVDKSQFQSTNSQTTYTYDAAGNLIKSVATIDSRPATGTFGTQLTTTTITYTYNADGYLTSSNSQRQNTITLKNNTTSTDQYSDTTSYSYTSGRLTQSIEKYSGTYVSANGLINAYEYNADGSLARLISTGLGNNTHQDIWIYRNNQLVDFIGKTGSTEQHSYTIVDGVIPTSVFPGDQNNLTIKATFDDQKRVTRIDQYINDQLSEYDTQTWTNAIPSTASLPLHKGFPVFNPDSPFSGKVGVLAGHEKFYWNSVSKTFQQYSNSTSTVQTNAQGYILGAVITTNYPYNTGQNSVKTETYTYAGCP